MRSRLALLPLVLLLAAACSSTPSAAPATTSAGGGGGSPSAMASTGASTAPGAGSSSMAPASAGSASAAPASGSWSTPATVGDQNTTFVKVSCSGDSFCVAADEGRHLYTFDGSSWSVATASPVTGNVSGLSCPSTTFCMITTLQNEVSTFDGSKWSKAAPLLKGNDASYAIDTAACASPTLCAAFASGVAYVWNGSTWTHSTADAPLKAAVDKENSTNTLPSNPLQEEVACAQTACVQVDTLGNSEVWSGASWLPLAVDKSANPQLTSVTCGSATFCVAVSNQTGAYIFSGNAWAAAPSGWPKGAIECTSESFCMAGGPGSFSTYDGTAWHQGPLSGSSGVQGVVACGADGFCVAVGAYGQTSVFKAG